MSDGIPLASEIKDQGEMMDFGIAYTMLSKPVQQLTDFDLLLIANDLRAKRVKFLQGQADRPGRIAAPKKGKPTEEEVAAKTEHLKNTLSNFKLDL